MPIGHATLSEVHPPKRTFGAYQLPHFALKTRCETNQKLSPPGRSPLSSSPSTNRSVGSSRWQQSVEGFDDIRALPAGMLPSAIAFSGLSLSLARGTPANQGRRSLKALAISPLRVTSITSTSAVSPRRIARLRSALSFLSRLRGSDRIEDSVERPHSAVGRSQLDSKPPTVDSSGDFTGRSRFISAHYPSLWFDLTVIFEGATGLRLIRIVFRAIRSMCPLVQKLSYFRTPTKIDLGLCYDSCRRRRFVRRNHLRCFCRHKRPAIASLFWSAAAQRPLSQRFQRLSSLRLLAQAARPARRAALYSYITRKPG